jgi:hypothetical protein
MFSRFAPEEALLVFIDEIVVFEMVGELCADYFSRILEKALTREIGL